MYFLKIKERNTGRTNPEKGSGQSPRISYVTSLSSIFSQYFPRVGDHFESDFDVIQTNLVVIPAGNY